MTAIEQEISELLALPQEQELSVPAKKQRKSRKDKGIKRVKAVNPPKSGGKRRAKKVSEGQEDESEIPLKRIGSTKHDVRHYERVTSVSGNSSLDCADQVARDLRGLDLEEVYNKVAKVLGETIVALRARYAKLNPGMQRMNLGNRYRAALPNKKEK